MDHSTDVVAIVNPVQAVSLCMILPETRPERRIPVAAAFLGITPGDVVKAAGMSPELRLQYLGARRGRTTGRGDLPSHFMVRLAKVLGVPFVTFWDDEALEQPRTVLRYSTERAGQPQRHRLRIAAG
jgi:hypothetical protein